MSAMDLHLHLHLDLQFELHLKANFWDVGASLARSQLCSGSAPLFLLVPNSSGLNSQPVQKHPPGKAFELSVPERGYKYPEIFGRSLWEAIVSERQRSELIIAGTDLYCRDWVLPENSAGKKKILS